MRLYFILYLRHASLVEEPVGVYTDGGAMFQLSLATIQVSETDSVADPALLMTIMETREALDEATTEEEVLQIREQNKGKISPHFRFRIFAILIMSCR